jgi:hypothetical protein
MMMHEQMGWDVNPEEIPLEESDLVFNAQVALLLFSILPDKIEGMSGSWLGKDFAGLEDIMNIYEIEHRREVFDYLLLIIGTASKHYEEQRKANENKARQ